MYMWRTGIVGLSASTAQRADLKSAQVSKKREGLE
jgi:hypothetical protein